MSRIQLSPGACPRTRFEAANVDSKELTLRTTTGRNRSAWLSAASLALAAAGAITLVAESMLLGDEQKGRQALEAGLTRALEELLTQAREVARTSDATRFDSLVDASRLWSRIEAAHIAGGGASDRGAKGRFGPRWAELMAQHLAWRGWSAVNVVAVDSPSPPQDAGLIVARVQLRHRAETPDPGGNGLARCALLRLELCRDDNKLRLVDVEDLGAGVRVSDILQLELAATGSQNDVEAQKRLGQALAAAWRGDREGIEEHADIVRGGDFFEDQLLGKLLAREWDAQRRLLSARLDLDEREVKQAEGELEQVPAAAARESFLALKLKCRALAARGSHHEVARLGRRCLELHGDDGEVGAMLSEALHRLDLPDESLAICRRALAVLPDSTSLLVRLGLGLPGAGKQELRERVLAAKCTDPQLFRLHSSFLAEADFEAAAALPPAASLQARRSRISTHVDARLRHGADSLDLWDSLEDADALAVLDLLARRMLDSGRLPQLLTRARDRFPDAVQARWWEAVWHESEGRHAESVAILLAHRATFEDLHRVEVVEEKLIRALVKLQRRDEALREARNSTQRLAANVRYELLVETRCGTAADAAAALLRCVESGEYNDVDELLGDEELGAELRVRVLPAYLPLAVEREQAKLSALVAKYRPYLSPELLPPALPPPEQNAYFVWAQLPPELRSEPIEFAEDGEEEDEDAVPFPRQAVADVLWRDADFPAGALADKLNEWLEELKAPMEILDAGLARERFQVPRHGGSVRATLPNWRLGPVRALVEARLLRVKLLAREENARGAHEEISKALAVQRLWRSDPVSGLAELIANAFETTILRRLRWLSRKFPRDVELHRQLILDVARGDSVRTPGCTAWLDYLPVVEQLELDPAAETFGVPQGLQAPQTLDGKNALAVLLQGHAEPFDREETLRLAAEVFRRLCRSRANPALEDPDDATLGIAELEPIDQLRLPDDFLKGAIFLGIRPRAAALEPARGALAGVRNPLGKLLVYQLAELLRVARNKISGTLREHAVSREATLAVLGLRLHRAIDGTPAPSLQALVDKRLLPRLPQDPWSGDPLRYSAAEEKVWSVGANRIDDGGRGNEEAGADGDVVFGVR